MRPRPRFQASAASQTGLCRSPQQPGQRLSASRASSSEAAGLFRAALALRPDYAVAHYQSGQHLRMRKENATRPKPGYRQALALRPDLAEAHYNLGSVLLQPTPARSGRGTLRAGDRSEADYAEAHHNLGNVLRKQGQCERAVACYQRALALRPDYAEAHNNLGIMLRGQGQLERAMAHYRQALALRPDFAEAHNNLGGVLLAHASLTKRSRISSKHWRSCPITPRFTTIWAPAAGPGQVRRSGDMLPASPGHSARLRRGPQQLGRRAAGPGPARRSGGMLPASTGPPARRCRRGIGPGPVLSARRRLRARLARLRSAAALAGGRQRPSFPRCRAGRASPWPAAACCWSPSKAWEIRSNSSATPGC